jgi:molybdopterin molybdotransferase
MLSLAQAKAIVAARVERPLGEERVALDAALGRVLATDVAAPRDVPGFAHSAMDGYAVRHADLAAGTPLRCIGVALAGGDTAFMPGAGECVRITTGAPLPPGTDTVVIKENARVDGDFVSLACPPPASGANVRGAHDDWRAGDLALRGGTRIGAAQLGVLASFGYDTVAVRRRVQAIAIATGDELIAPGTAWREGLRYDSNGPVLAALCATHGVELVARWRVRDDRQALRAALLEGARSSDLVITTGGVSAGEADYLPGIVAETGETWLWKVAMRPGMPVLAGQVEGTPVFALPGNPVSVVATFCALVRPALARLSGCPALDPAPRVARLATAAHKTHDRLELRRATLRVDDDAVLQATPHASLSSGALRSVAESDVLVELAETQRDWSAGERVPTYALHP